jgi:hypothetical protein
MRYAICLFATFVLGACATPVAESESRALPEFQAVPKRPDFASSTVAKRGWLIYQQVAAREIAKGVLPVEALRKVSQVIALEQPSGYLVRFVTTLDQEPVVLYDVGVSFSSDEAPKPQRRDPPTPLDGASLRQWQAHLAWLGRLHQVQLCAPSHQIVTIPAGDEPGWLSYLVPMPDSPGFMQLGGFHVLHLDETGAVVSQRPLNPECGGWRMPADAVAFTIAQATTRVPSEADVYSSLFWDLPLFVLNAESTVVWAVDNAGVADVSDRVPELVR